MAVLKSGKAEEGMERRSIQQERWRELALSALRVTVLALAVVGTYFGISYVFKRSESEVSRFKQRKDSEYSFKSDQTGMRIVNDEGELAMEITSGEVVLSQDQRTATFKNADAKYYEDGQVSLTMHAGEITYDTQTEDFVLKDGLKIATRDGMQVTAPEVLWRRAKESDREGYSGTKVPAFSFPQGVQVASREGNKLQASYMQADRELMYLEFVGNVRGDVAELSDTQFLSERKLTNVEQLKLGDIVKLGFEAEQVIYDKRSQVLLATSRFYDRSFRITDLDGREVKVDKFQTQPQQVTFRKEKITIRCNHIEAHVGRKWAEAVGNIDMVIPPDQPNPNDDKALKVVKRFNTHIKTEDVEYFWGRDYVATHSRSRVEQEDRLALADRITYWGDKRQVLLDGNATLVNGSGKWMFEEDLIEVDNHDMRRALSSYTELYGDRAVVYLNNNDFIASGNVRVRQDERDTQADTIVYEDTIKRITAQGDVKFTDKDGQTFLCGGLVFHKKSDFIEVRGGSVADIRLPAKFANDINKAIADTREQPPPPPVTDPDIPAELPTRDPNLASKFPEPGPPTGLPPLPGLDGAAGAGAEPGFIPDLPEITPPAGAGAVTGPVKPSPATVEPVGPQRVPAAPSAAPPAGTNVADADKRPKPIRGRGR
jgi:lipopolysaccharide export system protein LptA/lipopolysaccharide export system protein LptC